MKRKLWIFSWALLAIALSIARFGYTYGTSDHDELLAPVLHELDPELFPHDPFVQTEIERFGVRTPVRWIIATLSRGIGIETAVLLLWALAMLGICVSIYWLARRLGAVPLIAGVSTVAIVAVLPHWTVGDTSIPPPLLAPSQLAWALILPAFALALSKRYLIAGLVLGLAAWMQVLEAFLAALVLLFALVVHVKKDRLSTLLHVGLPALLVAGPLVVWVLSQQPESPAAEPGQLSLWTLWLEYRAPHHYLPSQFREGSWLKFFLLAVVGIASWLRLPRHEDRRFVLAALGGIALICAIGWLFTEWIPVFSIAVFQPFRITVLATLFLTIGILRYTWTQSRKAQLSAAIQFADRRFWWIPLVCTLVVAGLLGGPFRERIHARGTDPNLQHIEEWARSQLPTDALVLVPPSNSSFRVGARRSVYATFKAWIFHEEAVRSWWARLQEVSPLPGDPTVGGFALQDSLDAAFFRNTTEDWRRLASEIGATTVLLDLDRTASPPSGTPLVHSGNWALYSLRRRSGQALQ